MRNRNSGRVRKKGRMMLVGALCLVIGMVLLGFYTLGSSKSLPPVDVLLDESRIGVESGVLYDYLVVQNRAADNLTVVVVIKTPLDDSPRSSAPVTVCGRCKATVQIREVQPQPDQNMEYYQNAIEYPDFVRAEYPPTFLTSLTNLSLPLGFGAMAAGLILLVYTRPR